MVRCLNLLSYSRSNTIQSLALSSGNWLWDFANYVTCRNPKLIFIGWPLEFFLNLLHEYYFVLTVVRLCIHNFANVPIFLINGSNPFTDIQLKYPYETKLIGLSGKKKTTIESSFFQVSSTTRKSFTDICGANSQ